MASTTPNRPLVDALNKARIGNVGAFAGQPRDICIDILRQAHALTVVLRSAHEDAADIEDKGGDSALSAVTEAIKADAMDALGSLIALAYAAAVEG